MAKKRANGEGSLRKRSDGGWEGRYTAGHDPETGKAFYKNVLAKTQKGVQGKAGGGIGAGWESGCAQNRPIHGNPVMFPAPVTGKIYGPDCLGRLHKPLLKKAGITENITLHGLRHTFATLAIQQGIDAKTVSSILGHYSAGFTLDTYTHVTSDKQI